MLKQSIRAMTFISRLCVNLHVGGRRASLFLSRFLSYRIPLVIDQTVKCLGH